MKTIRKVLFIFLLAIPLCSCTATNKSTITMHSGQTIDYSYRQGTGPTIIFESGLGDGMEVWSNVIALLPKTYATFTYSRPGYGSFGTSQLYPSDHNGQRTGKDIAQALKTVLQQAGVPAPYILVGHSTGGLYALSFAMEYPNDTAGTLLVDGRPATFTARCTELNAGMCKPPGFLKALMPNHQQLELNGLDSTCNTILKNQHQPLPQTTVIAAGQPDIVSSERFQQLWLEEQQRFARKNNARYIKVADSAHYIQKERPDIVARELQLLHSRSKG